MRGAAVASVAGGVDRMARAARGAQDQSTAGKSNKAAYSRSCTHLSASSAVRQAWQANLNGATEARAIAAADRDGPFESVQIRVERTDCVGLRGHRIPSARELSVK
eukprot:6182892-Pleurochrysis_carterae.AAC.1